MILQLIKSRRRTILVDINTQKDFLLAEGKVCIRNHRRILAHIRRVIAWARIKGIPIVSTCEIYPNGSHDGNGIKYCVDGTEGQKKIRYTIVSDRVCFPADGNTDLPRDILKQYKQVILQKRCVDPFDEPRIDRLLSELRAGEFILIGASTEGAVKATALGLLQRGKNVTIIVDAVGTHNSIEAKLALRKMQAKGAKLVETRELAGPSHLRQVGICHCESCQAAIFKTITANKQQAPLIRTQRN